MELVVALGVFAVGILSLVLLFVQGIKLMNQSENITRANEVARLAMETVKMRGHGAVPPGSAVYDGRNLDPKDSTLDFPPDPYPSKVMDGVTYSLRVSTQPGGRDLRFVRIEVWWGRDSRIAVETALHS